MDRHAAGIERLRDSDLHDVRARAKGCPPETGGPVHVDQEGRTWFAPSTGGLHWLKDGRVGSITAAGLPEDVVYSIAGSRDRVVGRSKRGGLTRISLQREGAIARTYRRADGLAEDSVYAVHESRDGTVWAGTLGSGASRLQDGAFTTFTVADGLASNTVTADRRRRRRHDVVRHAERPERLVERRMAEPDDSGRIAFGRRHLSPGGLAGPSLDRHGRGAGPPGLRACPGARFASRLAARADLRNGGGWPGMALGRDLEARASGEARAAARGRPGSRGRGRVRTVRWIAIAPRL